MSEVIHLLLSQETICVFGVEIPTAYCMSRIKDRVSFLQKLWNLLNVIGSKHNTIVIHVLYENRTQEQLCRCAHTFNQGRRQEVMGFLLS